jgi:hypothetical protein
MIISFFGYTPVGLVSDALELAQYSDVTLYIVGKTSPRK